MRESVHTKIDTRCHVRLVSTTAEFDALQDEWNRLIDQADVSIFQTFEWLRTWWKWFAQPQYRLHILLFTYNNRIVGIAPLFTERLDFLGVRVAKRLQFIGRGLSDYVDLIIQPGSETMVLTTFAYYLRSTQGEWDVLDIEDVNEKSLLVQTLPHFLENHGLRVYRYQGNVCPQITLPTSGELLVQSLSQGARYKYKRKLKKLREEFRSEVEIVQHETDDIAKAVKTFAHIHGDRWRSQGYPSAFDDEKLQAFHVDFSRKFARRGWLRMIFLHVDGTPVAVNYDFNFKKHIYMYHSNAHGDEKVMKCSPGLLIRSIAMINGINEGMTMMDFLRGDESYKYEEWKAVDSKNYLIRVSSASTKSHARFILFLAYELLTKCKVRLQRETYEFRRFNITKSRSIKENMYYVGLKLADLLILGSNFITRHIPIRAVQRLQLQRIGHIEERLASTRSEETSQEKKQAVTDKRSDIHTTTSA